MTKILAIDSSTEACSVAILDNDKIYQRYQLAPRRHAELLLPMVDELLKESGLSLPDLDAIACCVGPGAFTGLRIAVSVAQGLAFASKLPCIAVSSLEILAINAFKQTDANICLSAIDARMKEVYFAVFMRKNEYDATLIEQECVHNPLEIELDKYSINRESGIVFVGSGWSEYEFSASIKQLKLIQLESNQLEFKQVDRQFPNAVDMLSTADDSFKANKLLKPEQLQPIYIRNNVAKKKLLKKQPIIDN